MNSSLFETRQLKHLAFILKCSRTDIEELLKDVEAHYYEFTEEKKDKEGNLKKYADGTVKTRTISPSKPLLKRLQASIKRNILDKFKMPAHVQGGTKGKSNISNALCHKGKKYKFTTDLQNFFPTVNHKAVYKAFLDLKYKPYQAKVLTKLTTYKFGLPQGASTSAHLSNLCFLAIDEKLLDICREHGITYTRYIDDLTFSSPKDFKIEIVRLLEIIKSNGYKISYRKTLYKANQSITGIDVFNNFIDVPTHIKVKAQAEIDSNSPVTSYRGYSKQVRLTNKNIVSRFTKLP